MAANSSPFHRIPPHHIIKQAFGREMADGLLCHAISRQAEFENSKVKKGDEKGSDDPSTRLSSFLRHWRGMRPEVEERMRALFPALLNTLRVTPFASDQLELELALVAHGDGAFFTPHIDTVTGKTSGEFGRQRNLSAVYYFHSEPKAFSGGALRLYALAAPAGKDAEFLDIEPEHDMLLVFPSWALHEVRPVSCPSGNFADSRFAVNCWFCRKVESQATSG